MSLQVPERRLREVDPASCQVQAMDATVRIRRLSPGAPARAACGEYWGQGDQQAENALTAERSGYLKQECAGYDDQYAFYVLVV
jgi:hypothetical protein